MMTEVYKGFIKNTSNSFPMFMGWEIQSFVIVEREGPSLIFLLTNGPSLIYGEQHFSILIEAAHKTGREALQKIFEDCQIWYDGE